MKNPTVTITMEDGGVITIELYPDVAPNTVRNFISLIQKGYYDGLIFHRVIEGFMIHIVFQENFLKTVLSMS